jgi:uncharacterized iron-regulated membrane protein
MKSLFLRTIHRRAALLLVPVLALSAITGMTYRVGRNWFGMSDETGKLVRSIHEGAFLGAAAPFYVLITGAGLLLLIVSGVTMWRRRDLAGLVRTEAGTQPPARRTVRWFHRVVSMVLFIPLAVTALTGAGFRLTQSWLGWSEKEAKWLMDIHQGTLIFGREYRIYYVLFIGIGLMFMIATGMRLQRIFNGRRRATPSTLD